MIELAKLLKERYGSSIFLYCAGPQEVEFYEQHRRAGLFTAVTDADMLLRTAAEAPPDEESVIARARAFEARIGCTYNFLAVANRHLGRGYALGGFYHPRSRISERTSYLQMVNSYNTALEFWDRELKEKGITLVLNGGKESACMARVHGVPYRVLACARYQNYHYWALNEFNENPAIEAAYQKHASAGAESIREPYLSHVVNREKFLRSASFGSLLWKLVVTTARHGYWRLRGYKKGRGYFLSENLRYHVRQWRDYNRLRKAARVTLADLKGRSFVFYPLHLEPEASLQMLSPEYFYQLSSIAATSRDLPVGVLLAVKETFAALGRRPDNFYDQIAEFKNVVLLDTMEFGLNVVREAAAVVTINGTAGFEAAVMGKPVVAFGRHNVYNFLPHVFVVRHDEDLVRSLQRALGPDFDAPTAQENGRRFLEAVVRMSFDLRAYDFVNVQNYEMNTVTDACQALVASLSESAVVGPQA